MKCPRCFVRMRSFVNEDFIEPEQCFECPECGLAFFAPYPHVIEPEQCFDGRGRSDA